MKVSIIIPAYNAEKWIKNCLKSVVRQSYENLEIIVLNDGSTDCTLDILKAFTKIDERIVVINKLNSGTYLSRKEGLQKSTGDVIFNADADDFLEPDAIELLVQKMLTTNADMVIGNHYELRNGRKKLIRNKVPQNQNQLELVKSLLNNDIKGYVWGKLFKRELLTNMDYEVPQLLQEDLLANLHVFLNNKVKVGYEPAPIYNYIIHENSANSSRNPIFIENVFEFIDITKKLLDKANLLPKLEDDFRLFTCRTWIVYSRLGGKLAKNKKFRGDFYKKNFTAYAKINLALHHKIEMMAYRYHYDFGRITTKSMKRLNNLIS